MPQNQMEFHAKHFQTFILSIFKLVFLEWVPDAETRESF